MNRRHNTQDQNLELSCLDIYMMYMLTFRNTFFQR